MVVDPPNPEDVDAFVADPKLNPVVDDVEGVVDPNENPEADGA